MATVLWLYSLIRLLWSVCTPGHSCVTIVTSSVCVCECVRVGVCVCVCVCACESEGVCMCV